MVILANSFYANNLTKENSTKGSQVKTALPKTVEEAVNGLIKAMSDENKKLIKNTKKEDLIKFHHTWGKAIRNNFRLWGENKELLKSTGTKHPDEASMVIIEAVWTKLQKK